MAYAKAIAPVSVSLNDQPHASPVTADHNDALRARNATALTTVATPAAPFTSLATGTVAGLVFLASWGVVALSMYIIMQVALDRGLPQAAAIFLAAPAAALPLRTTLGVVRERTAERALLGHLWVLNGSAGWAVVALTAIWLLITLQSALDGSRGGVALTLLSLGFLPVLGALVMFNRWLFSR